MNDQGESLYLPGAASLAEQIDTRILIVLRDGRNLVGVLRSFDQYVNLILEETVERVIYKGRYFCFVDFSRSVRFLFEFLVCLIFYKLGKYCDIPLGLFLVRGDNLILLGEVDEDREKNMNMEELTPTELSELMAAGDAPKLEWDFE
jgi:U6 snRNA-associated Sm-like protein LSm1